MGRNHPRSLVVQLLSSEASIWIFCDFGVVPQIGNYVFEPSSCRNSIVEEDWQTSFLCVRRAVKDIGYLGVPVAPIVVS